MFDIHIHGIGNLDTKTQFVEDILKIALTLKQRGIKGFLPTIYSAPINEMRRQMYVIRQAINLQSDEHAQILGIHLEGPFLNHRKAGALDASSFISPSEYSLESLIDGYTDIIKIITIAPELDKAVTIIKKAADLGIVMSLGHSDATYNEAQRAHNIGARGITHLFNAMRGFHHRDPGLAGYGLLNSEIYIEVIADRFHLHEETIKMIFRLKNRERIIIISDSVKSKGDVKQGIRDIKGTLMGGSTTIDESVKLLRQLGIADEDITLAVNDNPLRYLSIL